MRYSHIFMIWEERFCNIFDILNSNSFISRSCGIGIRMLLEPSIAQSGFHHESVDFIQDTVIISVEWTTWNQSSNFLISFFCNCFYLILLIIKGNFQQLTRTLFSFFSRRSESVWLFLIIPTLSEESSGVLLVTVLNFQIAKKLSWT